MPARAFFEGERKIEKKYFVFRKWKCDCEEGTGTTRVGAAQEISRDFVATKKHSSMTTNIIVSG